MARLNNITVLFYIGYILWEERTVNLEAMSGAGGGTAVLRVANVQMRSLHPPDQTGHPAYTVQYILLIGMYVPTHNPCFCVSALLY